MPCLHRRSPLDVSDVEPRRAYEDGDSSPVRADSKPVPSTRPTMPDSRPESRPESRAGSRPPSRKQRHRGNLRNKRKADNRRREDQSQTFEAISCHCATRCSPARPDFCELYGTAQLPVAPNPLKPWTSSVRLIRLKSGSGDDLVECDLFPASLSEGHYFTALSYVWGCCGDRIPIHVNGHATNITRNLHAALAHLRNAHTDTTLWVDAICIDQGNLLERTSQVEHMPEVYSAASVVVAWLGEEANGSSEAMNYINNYVRVTDDDLAQHGKFSTPQLESLWARPYWGRVWVVQELASAYSSRGKCFIKCGNESVSFDQFRRFLGEFLANQFYTGGDNVLRPKHLTNLSVRHEGKPFLEILSESAFLESTDLRDRIYGIRGISPGFYRNKIPVDYEICFQELCKRVILEYVKKEKSLDILCQFKRFPRVDGFPSWVRDLSSYNRGISPSIHAASAGSRPELAISDNILHVKGKCFGIANQLRGPCMFPPPLRVGQSWPEMQNLKKLESFALAALRKRHGDLAPEDLHERFMDMISGDRWRGASMQDTKIPFIPQEIWRSICHYKISSLVDERMQSKYKYFMFLFSPLIGRTIFDTSDGDIGIGPPDMQKGDTICVLYGCNYCAVLRKLKKGHYTFIGPAYVDGAMSGERIRQELDEQGNQEAVEQFHIH
jgi:hypothetical protein